MLAAAAIRTTPTVRAPAARMYESGGFLDLCEKGKANLDAGTTGDIWATTSEAKSLADMEALAVK